VDLAVRALPLWRQLEAETGTSILTLTGAVDHGSPEATSPLRAALAAAGQASEFLTPAQASVRWPGLRFDTRVLFHPQAGRLHADHAVAALQQAAAARGAAIRHGTQASRMRTLGGGHVEVTADGQALLADVTVIAAGSWTSKVLSALGIPAPALRVTQEQPATFHASLGHAPGAASWPSFIHHGGAGLPAGQNVYGLDSGEGIKVGFHAVGPVTDPDDRDRTVDPAAEQRLRDYAGRWLPGVDASRADSATCLYTITPDDDFLIDRRGPFVTLGGFSGHGFKFGSVLGELAADLVEGKPGVARFALGRFPAT
jgi:sarcosine oxidase